MRHYQKYLMMSLLLVAHNYVYGMLRRTTLWVPAQSWWSSFSPASNSQTSSFYGTSAENSPFGSQITSEQIDRWTKPLIEEQSLLPLAKKIEIPEEAVSLQRAVEKGKYQSSYVSKQVPTLEQSEEDKNKSSENQAVASDDFSLRMVMPKQVGHMPQAQAIMTSNQVVKYQEHMPEKKSEKDDYDLEREEIGSKFFADQDETPEKKSTKDTNIDMESYPLGASKDIEEVISNEDLEKVNKAISNSLELASDKISLLEEEFNKILFDLPISNSSLGMFKPTQIIRMSRAEAANILGVSKNASKEEIQKAYVLAAKKIHPDVGGNNDDFRKLVAAKNILKTGIKGNRSYDQDSYKGNRSYDQDSYKRNDNFSDNQYEIEFIEKLVMLGLIFNEIYNDIKFNSYLYHEKLERIKKDLLFYKEQLVKNKITKEEAEMQIEKALKLYNLIGPFVEMAAYFILMLDIFLNLFFDVVDIFILSSIAWGGRLYYLGMIPLRPLLRPLLHLLSMRVFVEILRPTMGGELMVLEKFLNNIGNEEMVKKRYEKYYYLPYINKDIEEIELEISKLEAKLKELDAPLAKLKELIYQG